MAILEITITLNDDARDILRELQIAFRVNSNAAALLRSLALARVCARNATDDGKVTFIKDDGTPLVVMMRS